MKEFDYIILGGGCAGLSLAYELDINKKLDNKTLAVIEPRKVLAEFGLELGEEIQVRVHDSTADMRYIVVPAQPKESIGLSEKELKDWVTRDSMIGVGLPRSPI